MTQFNNPKTGDVRLDLIAMVDGLDTQERGVLFTSMLFIVRDDRKRKVKMWDDFYKLLAVAIESHKKTTFEIKK